jgi:hypothetical protein
VNGVGRRRGREPGLRVRHRVRVLEREASCSRSPGSASSPTAAEHSSCRGSSDFIARR